MLEPASLACWLTFEFRGSVDYDHWRRHHGSRPRRSRYATCGCSKEGCCSGCPHMQHVLAHDNERTMEMDISLAERMHNPKHTLSKRMSSQLVSTMPLVSPLLVGHAHLHSPIETTDWTATLFASTGLRCCSECLQDRQLVGDLDAHQNQLSMALCWPSAPAPSFFMYATTSFSHCM